MRLIRTMTIAALTVGGLVACGQGDEAFRASYRTKAVAACTQGAARAPNAGNVDTNRFCNCMVDGYMRATSTEQLKAERNQTAPPAAAQQAMMQCVREQGGAVPGAPPESSAAPAVPETAPAAPPEPAPVEENATAE